MASADTSTALFDRTNALLSTFSQQALRAHDLVSAVPVRDYGRGQGSQHTENMTRWTQQDVTGATGHSDSGLVMDAMDRDRAGEDLKVFKDHVSTLKFAYLESNAKLEFVNHILNPDGYTPISKEVNDQFAQERLHAKAQLKARKERVTELESNIRNEAEELEKELKRRNDEAEHAARLVRECEAMETEIAMLKNKRSATERLTIDEAAAMCEQQENELVQIGQRTKQCEDEMKTLKPRIKASKMSIERYSHTAKQLRKEQDERDAKGVQDVRAEEGCEWIDTTAALYKSLVGVHNAYAVGNPPNELVFEYGSSENKEELRRLSIALGEDGRMVGAQLVDSSEDIQDIVQPYIASQDIRSLVQELRTRFGW
ncbi:uncharacterized protein JCM10292_006826 [Rhodotorula paludigena]|uniref:uncharacterized protein n=1 Tax=Rhodotorula paludigena TaxID=86838 RepID=UPI003171B433